MATQAPPAAVISRTRSNGYYGAAMDASPKYVAASQLRTKLIEAQQSLPGVPSVPAPADTDVDLAAWLDSVVEAQAAEHAREVKVNALRAQIILCDKTITDVAVTETDQILAHLHDALTEVMAQTAEVVDRLNGAATPQEVINQGVGDVWKELGPLRVEYDSVRQAQEWAMAGEDAATWSRSDYLWDDPLASDLIIRNLDEVYPEWKRKSSNTFRISDAPQPDPRPWPSDPVEQLVWFHTSPAQVWVPTLSQLARLNRERTARLNQTQDDELLGAHQ